MSTTTFNWEGHYSIPGFKPRAMAYLIDTFIISFIFSFILFATIFFEMSLGSETFSTDLIYLLFSPNTILLCEFIYFVLFSTYLTDGQTIGKKIANIRIMSVDSYGNLSSLKGKNIPIMIRTFFILIDCLIGWYFIKKSVNNQRLGDSIAKTVVVYTY